MGGEGREGEWIRGRPAAVERQELAVNRKCSRPGRIEPAQTDLEDGVPKEGRSREKDAERNIAREPLPRGATAPDLYLI